MTYAEERKHQTRINCLFRLMATTVRDPDAPIDHERQYEQFWHEAWRDALNVHGVLDNDPDPEEISIAISVDRAWAYYWSKRFPDDVVRETFRQLLEVSPLAKLNAKKARAQLRKQGVTTLEKEKSDARR